MPVEPSETRHFSQIDGDMDPADQTLVASWNPRAATFIQAELVAPMPPTGTLLDRSKPHMQGQSRKKTT
jgi:hypothetical protein